jgi:hypothetical protein
MRKRGEQWICFLKFEKIVLNSADRRQRGGDHEVRGARKKNGRDEVFPNLRRPRSSGCERFTAVLTEKEITYEWSTAKESI